MWDVRREGGVIPVADFGPGGYPLDIKPRGAGPLVSVVPLPPRAKKPTAPASPPDPMPELADGAVTAAAGALPQSKATPVVTPPAGPAVAPGPIAPAVVPDASQTSLNLEVTERLSEAWQGARQMLPSPAILIALLCAVLIVAVARGGLEFMALTAFRFGEWMAALRTWLSNGRRNRERRAFGRVSEEAFRAEVERRKTLIARLVRRSEILYAQADWLEISSLTIPGIVRRLRRRASWNLEAAEREQARLENREKLWAELELTRRDAKDVETRERVHMLLRLLGSKVEAAAAKALAELNQIGKSSFDWATLLPDGLPGDVRDKLVKLLRLMAGASTISEARTAHGRARQVLQSNNSSWREAT
jgi:hypothetical protein